MTRIRTNLVVKKASSLLRKQARSEVPTVDVSKLHALVVVSSSEKCVCLQ
jgi:hypothetical protein